MANTAIEKRRTQLVAAGKDPGPNYGTESKIGPKTLQLTMYGAFIADPSADSAWFLVDVDSLDRFRSAPQ